MSRDIICRKNFKHRASVFLKADKSIKNGSEQDPRKVYEASVIYKGNASAVLKNPQYFNNDNMLTLKQLADIINNRRENYIKEELVELLKEEFVKHPGRLLDLSNAILKNHTYEKDGERIHVPVNDIVNLIFQDITLATRLKNAALASDDLAKKLLNNVIFTQTQRHFAIEILDQTINNELVYYTQNFPNKDLIEDYFNQPGCLASLIKNNRNINNVLLLLKIDTIYHQKNYDLLVPVFFEIGFIKGINQSIQILLEKENCLTKLLNEWPKIENKHKNFGLSGHDAAKLLIALHDKNLSAKQLSPVIDDFVAHYRKNADFVDVILALGDLRYHRIKSPLLRTMMMIKTPSMNFASKHLLMEQNFVDGLSHVEFNELLNKHLIELGDDEIEVDILKSMTDKYSLWEIILNVLDDNNIYLLEQLLPMKPLNYDADNFLELFTNAIDKLAHKDRLAELFVNKTIEMLEGNQANLVGAYIDEPNRLFMLLSHDEICQWVIANQADILKDKQTMVDLLSNPDCQAQAIQFYSTHIPEAFRALSNEELINFLDSDILVLANKKAFAAALQENFDETLKGLSYKKALQWFRKPEIIELLGGLKFFTNFVSKNFENSELRRLIQHAMLPIACETPDVALLIFKNATLLQHARRSDVLSMIINHYKNNEFTQQLQEHTGMPLKDYLLGMIVHKDIEYMKKLLSEDCKNLLDDLDIDMGEILGVMGNPTIQSELLLKIKDERYYCYLQSSDKEKLLNLNWEHYKRNTIGKEAFFQKISHLCLEQRSVMQLINNNQSFKKFVVDNPQAFYDKGILSKETLQALDYERLTYSQKAQSFWQYREIVHTPNRDAAPSAPEAIKRRNSRDFN